MTINFSTLFTRLGKAFKVGDDIVTAAATTIPTDRDAYIAELAALDATDELNACVGLNSALDTFRGAAQSAITGLVSGPAVALLQIMVHNDHPLLSETNANCVAELIAQMTAGGASVDANEPAVAVTYGDGGSSDGPEGDNTGNGILVFSVLRGDGRTNEFILPETIDAAITSVSSSGTATWTLMGDAAVPASSVNWPGGSGLSSTLASVTSASNTNVQGLGTYGGFETYASSTTPHLPAGFLASVGTLGTHIVLTDIEVQSVTINGAPTGGWYVLKFTDRASRVYSTAPLAYNATSSDVEAELKKLPGLSQVSVTSTGASPDITLTITFTGVTNPATLTYASALTGGSPTITPAVVTASSANVVRGSRALTFVGDSSTLTTIQVPVTLAAGTQYAVNIWTLVDVVPAAGVLKVDLVDGIGGTTLNDAQGTANSLTINLPNETTSFASHPVVFRTPAVLPPTVYLRLRLTTALSTGSKVFMDELCMVPMTELYTGGLYAAAFSGPDDFAVGDSALVTVTNDMRGALHTWCSRAWSLRENRLLLPSDASNAETISDTLIA